MGPFERLGLYLRDLPVVEATAWILLINVAAFFFALGLGHLVIRLCRRRYAFAAPGPLSSMEVALALVTVAVNFAVSWVGFIGWKEGFIIIRSESGLQALLDFAVLFLVMDFLMYVLHRLSHQRWLYPWMHATHHRYENPRPLSLFVLNPIETAAFGLLWIAVLRVYAPTWNGMTLFMAVNLVSGVLGHVGVDPHPGSWNRVPGLNLVSTSVFHNRHHLERDRNLGFYTVLWDRLFGTLAASRPISTPMKGGQGVS